MTSCHPKGKAGWAQPDLRPDGDLTHGAGAVKLGGTRAPRAWEEPDFSVEADAQRHQSPCSDRRPDGRRKNEMKDRQPCQSEAAARLSSGSAIAVPAITISLKKAASRLPGSIDAKSPYMTLVPTTANAGVVRGLSP